MLSIQILSTYQKIFSNFVVFEKFLLLQQTAKNKQKCFLKYFF